MNSSLRDQLGVCSWCLRAADPQTLADMVELSGLGAVQLHLNPVCNKRATWGSVGRVLAARGIRIVSGMFSTIGEDYSTLESIRRTGGIVPDQHWEANWAIVENAARTAADLGLKLVSSHAGFLPEDPADPAFARIVERVARIGKGFGDSGVALLMETGQERPETLLRFLQAVHQRGATTVGVNFDPGNMILYAMGDPIAALRKLLPHVGQVHIKDAIPTTKPGTWGQEVAVGQGQVDWNALVGMLRGSQVQALTIEREVGPDPVKDIRAAVEYLMPLLAGA
jgi:L-ribulose-5-phosphate 3-epimerase